MSEQLQVVMASIENLRKDMVDSFRHLEERFDDKIDRIVEVEAEHDKRIDEAKRIADAAGAAAAAVRKDNSDGLKALDKEGTRTRKIVIYTGLSVLVAILTLVGVAAGFPGVRDYIGKLITGGG